jgi:hypothetical protein
MKYHESLVYTLLLLSYSFIGCPALGVIDNAEFIERCIERCNGVLNPYNISRIYAPNSRTYCHLGCMLRCIGHPLHTVPNLTTTAQIQQNLTTSPEVIRDGNNPTHSGTPVDLHSTLYPFSATPFPTPVELHSTSYPFPATPPPSNTRRWDESFYISAPTNEFPTPVELHSTSYPFPATPPPSNTRRWDESFYISAPTNEPLITTAGPYIPQPTPNSNG